jgi:hypothetical protein
MYVTRWAGHVASMGEMEMHMENLMGKDHRVDLGIDGKIILE